MNGTEDTGDVERWDAARLRALTAVLREGRTHGLAWLPGPDVAPVVVLDAAVEVVEVLARLVHDVAADLSAAAAGAWPAPHPSAATATAATRTREASARLAEARALLSTAATHARTTTSTTNTSTGSTGSTGATETTEG